MPDHGQKATDAEFRRLRKKINSVYEQAHREIVQKGQEFAQAHARREAQLRQQVADGKMTQEDFDAWMRGQVFQGKQWEAKRQQMADTLYNAEQVAQQMVNDSRFSVFAENANYMEYCLEHDAGINMGFGLYDADTVRRLVVEEPDLLPPKKRVGRDKSYKWYNRQIQTAITQGIIQGESIHKIARRIGKQTGETSMTAMLRNAHTMHTGAQNAGRMEGLHQAQRLGINVKKQWMATLDGRTRDAHADLDGQIKDVDKPFESDLGPIMYPGDPTAAPGNVWNCRCTLTYVYPDHQPTGEGVIIAKDGTKLLVQTQGQMRMQRRDNETGENIEYMTYREWEEMKRNEGAAPIDTPEHRQTTVVEGRDISDTWQRRPDQFDFEIDDIISAQGFDGKPRVVSAEEFDALVKQANGGEGFIAQRTYSAPDRETLEAYRQQLYEGRWYVDCSTGGASFGQGMYGVSRNGTSVSEGMRHEMEVYQEIANRRLTRAMTSDERFAYMAHKIESLGYDKQKTADLITVIGNQSLGAGTFSEAMDAFGRIGSDMDFVDEVKAKIDIADIYEKRIEPVHRVETFTMDKAARTIEYDKLQEEYQDYISRTGEEIGSSTYAAMKGYDAIIAPAEFSGAGGSTDYVVVLNRTACIFRGD